MRNSFSSKFAIGIVFLFFLTSQVAMAQSVGNDRWIRPEKTSDPSIWGIRGGIVFSLWPYGLEGATGAFGGGPRGLLRMGFDHQGTIYHMNYIAVEPVVNGKIEFSEISESVVDHKWGKLMWASNTSNPGSFYPAAGAKGELTTFEHNGVQVEQMTLFLFMEQFKSGAAPYFKISIRSDRPYEVGFEIFNQEHSALMDQCTLTATMGNYTRLRNLHLDGEVVNASRLYSDYDDIDFVEKASYPYGKMIKTGQGDLIALAETDESMESLSSWPDTEKAAKQAGWRYRPTFKLTQYWRKESGPIDPTLRVRVNGRAKYWSVANRNKEVYLSIPNGPAFENFELREKYYSGQKFFFGMSPKSVNDVLQDFN